MYKDLSLKEKAKVLLYGGKLGLTSVEDIAKLYDEAIGHKFLGDTNSQMDNSSGVLKWNEELLDFVYSVPKVTVAYDLPKRNKNKSEFDKYVQSMTNSYIKGNINTKDVNKLPWLYRNAVLGKAGNYKPAKYTSDLLKRLEWNKVNNIPSNTKQDLLDRKTLINDLENKFQNYTYWDVNEYIDDLNKFELLSGFENYRNSKLIKKRDYLNNNIGKVLNSYIPFFDPFKEDMTSFPAQIYRYLDRHGYINKNINVNNNIGGSGTDIISLNDNVIRLTPKSKQKTGLFNEFVETKNPSIKEAKEYKSGNIKNFGDHYIPTENVYLYQGIENGKFKIDYPENFNDTTLIYPVRNIKKEFLNPINKIDVIDNNGKSVGLLNNYTNSLPPTPGSNIYSKYQEDISHADVFERLHQIEDLIDEAKWDNAEKYALSQIKDNPDNYSGLYYKPNIVGAKPILLTELSIDSLINSPTLRFGRVDIGNQNDLSLNESHKAIENYDNFINKMYEYPILDSLILERKKIIKSEEYKDASRIKWDYTDKWEDLLNQMTIARNNFISLHPGLDKESIDEGVQYLVTDINGKQYPVSELNASILDNKMVLGNPNGGIFIGRFLDISQPQLDSLNAYLQKNPSWISRNDLGSFDLYRLDSPTLSEYLNQYYEHPNPNDPNVFVVGTTQPNKLWSNSYAKGGPIITPYGLWEYPGRDTIVPSNNITMDNVNYPVLGVSDTGDAKIMLPWNNYKFRGSIVYEHPFIDNQFQLGGLTKPFSYGDIPDVRYLTGGETQKYLNVPDYNVALYNTVSPLGDFPNFWGALTYRRQVKDKLKSGNIYERDYPVGNTQGEKTAMAAWAKRLGIPYDELDLPVYNGDTVTLPYSLVLEIPYDTNMLKNRIQLNKALLDKYSKYRYSNVVNAAIKADLYNLDKLRETYKTGKPVGLTEFGWNSRQLVNNGEILPIEDIYSPLNVLGNYNVRYDKPTNRLYYSDEYDFNQFENFVPGEPYRIRGYIDLDNNKGLGGNLFKKGGSGIHIKPENRGKFTALKKRTGHSASWFKAHGTPALKKMATFALNARKWNHKHDDGGYLYSEGGFLLAPYLYIE